jgi:hypothetical protein
MTTEEILILAGAVLVVLILLGLAGWLLASRRRKRRERLRRRYGSEYDATVDAKGRRAGIHDLDQREEERRGLDLRDVGDSTRADLRERMVDLQFRFVEEPQESLLELQRVVIDGLRARGYPIAEDRERSLRLLSVDHPDETPALRVLLDGSYGRDVGLMRELFLDSRRALLAVVGVSFTRRDLGDRGAVTQGQAAREPEPAQRIPSGSRPDPEGEARGANDHRP